MSSKLFSMLQNQILNVVFLIHSFLVLTVVWQLSKILVFNFIIAPWFFKPYIYFTKLYSQLCPMKAKSGEDYWFSGFYKHQSTSCATLSILNKFFNIYHYTGAYLGKGGGYGDTAPLKDSKIFVQVPDKKFYMCLFRSVNCKIIVVF